MFHRLQFRTRQQVRGHLARAAQPTRPSESAAPAPKAARAGCPVSQRAAHHKADRPRSRQERLAELRLLEGLAEFVGR
jgi:hypothetical protein